MASRVAMPAANPQQLVTLESVASRPSSSAVNTGTFLVAETGASLANTYTSAAARNFFEGVGVRPQMARDVGNVAGALAGGLTRGVVNTVSGVVSSFGDFGGDPSSNTSSGLMDEDSLASEVPTQIDDPLYATSARRPYQRAQRTGARPSAAVRRVDRVRRRYAEQPLFDVPSHFARGRTTNMGPPRRVQTRGSSSSSPTTRSRSNFRRGLP